MKTGSGIALVVVGLILMFALDIEDIGGVNIYLIGVILVVAGVVGVALGMIERNRDRSRETVEVRQHADGTEEVHRRTTRSSDPMA